MKTRARRASRLQPLGHPSNLSIAHAFLHEDARKARSSRLQPLGHPSKSVKAHAFLHEDARGGGHYSDGGPPDNPPEPVYLICINMFYLHRIDQKRKQSKNKRFITNSKRVRRRCRFAGKAMTGDASALNLLLSGDPELFAIVELSLLVSLAAVLLAALIGVPLGALLALTRFPGREAAIVLLNAHDGVAAGGRRPCHLSSSFSFRPARFLGPAVHAAGHGDRANFAGDPDHRRAEPADRRGPLGRVPRRARRHECRHRHPRSPR